MISLFASSAVSTDQPAISDILSGIFWVVVILALVLFPLLSKRSLRETVDDVFDAADNKLDQINEHIEPKVNNFTDRVKKNKKFLILLFIIIIGFSGIIISPHVTLCDRCHKLISVKNAYMSYEEQYCEDCYEEVLREWFE